MTDLTCTETRHVYTSDTIDGPEYCDCGKARNMMNPKMHTKWEKFRYWRQDFFGNLFDYFMEACILVFYVVRFLLIAALILGIIGGSAGLLWSLFGWWAVPMVALIIMAILGAMLT